MRWMCTGPAKAPVIEEIAAPLESASMVAKVNPDPELYVWSASANDYIRNGRRRNVDIYTEDVLPKLQAIGARYDPALEARITELEGEVRSAWPRVPMFALRGISTTGQGSGAGSLAAWAQTGYISEGGGNFFVFEPTAKHKSADAFLAKLMASAGSAMRYGIRAEQPVVLYVKTDLDFRIPPSGGNDGIDGTYPWTLNIEGQVFNLENLDVGAITRATHDGRQTGLIGDGVPPANVARTIGADGWPAWATNPRADDQQIALSRWIYQEVLEQLVSDIRTLP